MRLIGSGGGLAAAPAAEEPEDAEEADDAAERASGHLDPRGQLGGLVEECRVLLVRLGEQAERVRRVVQQADLSGLLSPEAAEIIAL